jgi:hypothetical protein
LRTSCFHFLYCILSLFCQSWAAPLLSFWPEFFSPNESAENASPKLQLAYYFVVAFFVVGIKTHLDSLNNATFIASSVFLQLVLGVTCLIINFSPLLAQRSTCK